MQKSVTSVFFKCLFLMGLLFGLGACTTTGIVGQDVDLALNQVKVVDNSQDGNEAHLEHNMREEVLYEFSKTPYGINNVVEAEIVLQIQNKPVANNSSGFLGLSQSTLSGAGQVYDSATGEKIGDFPWKASIGKSDDEQRLTSLAAKDVMARIYGSSRASKYSSNHGRYVKSPYVTRKRYALARNIPVNIGRVQETQKKDKPIGGLRLSTTDGVLPPDFVGPPSPTDAKKAPKVINAPQLPIQ